MSGTEGIADARRYAMEVASGVLDDNRVHDVAVVVSELVSNALEHGRGRVDLRVELIDDALEVTVGSSSDGDLDLGSSPVSAAERRGRGLRIVNRLTDGMVVRGVGDQIEVAVRFDQP